MPDARWRICSWETPDEEFPFSVMASNRGGTNGELTIQQAIAQILTAHYDPTFSEYSYGFRTGRSAHDAIKQSTAYIEGGCRFIVEIDLAKFFDTVNHGRLMSRLEKDCADKALLKLIRRYLRTGIMSDGLVEACEEGTPQGSPLSPILSLIVLDELDKFLEKRGLRFRR